MKNTALIPVFAALSVLASQGGELEPILARSERASERLGSAIGLLYTSQCVESPLFKKFLHRKLEISNAVTGFNKKYSTAWNNMMSDPVVKQAGGAKAIEGLFANLKARQEEQVSLMTEDNLDSYLILLKNLTNHFLQGVDPDDRRTILAAQYHNNPLREFEDKCVDTYYSKGNKKALGINFSIQYPISWLPSNGGSGHVIQKFTSRSGFGDIEVTIAITDFSSLLSPDQMALILSMNQEEEREFFNGFKEDGLKNLAFGEENVIPSTIQTKDIVLERHSGILVDAKGTGKRMDMKTESWTRCYMIIYRGKLLMITGSFTRVVDELEQMDTTIQKTIADKTALAKKFVDLMANTFVLNP